MRMNPMTALMKSSSCPKNDQIQCSCPCDINTDICDFECCCDSDCSMTEIKLFGNDCRGEMMLLSRKSRHEKRFLNEKDRTGESLQKNVFKCGGNRRMNKIVNDEKTDFDFQRLMDFVEVCRVYPLMVVQRISFSSLLLLGRVSLKQFELFPVQNNSG